MKGRNGKEEDEYTKERFPFEFQQAYLLVAVYRRISSKLLTNIEQLLGTIFCLCRDNWERMEIVIKCISTSFLLLQHTFCCF
jgi:hypothetical protein